MADHLTQYQEHLRRLATLQSGTREVLECLQAYHKALGLASMEAMAAFQHCEMALQRLEEQDIPDTSYAVWCAGVEALLQEIDHAGKKR